MYVCMSVCMYVCMYVCIELDQKYISSSEAQWRSEAWTQGRDNGALQAGVSLVTNFKPALFSPQLRSKYFVTNNK